MVVDEPRGLHERVDRGWTDEAETPAVIRQSDGSFLATGRASLDDVLAMIGEEFDVGEAAHDVDTLGGYLVMRAGHVPVRGEL